MAIAALASVLVLGQPAPAPARADLPCEVVTGPVGAISGAVGLGNPAGDVCETVTGGLGSVTGAITSPVTGALEGLGNDVFEQLTAWTAEGASWLMGQVVKAIDSSTTPQLDTEGFLRSYGRMAAIAAVLAAAMLLFAILEGIAQGNPGLLVRVVLINVPVAFLGMSLAFAIVQLLLGVTDGLSAAVAGVSHHDSTRFFETAIGDLGHVGGQVGKGVGEAAGQKPTETAPSEAAGTVAVPLFVGFLAAIVGAFAAFFVWLELLMRDAAVYAVSLFMPLALAASIWPRWTGALRRTGELLVAVIGSKFVIVAIVSLAASLIAEEGGSVEHVLAAAALMCLACFAPFVLLRLIPFSEGALAAAYGRRSAAGGAVSGVQMASDVAILRNMGRSREGSGVALWSAEGGGSSGGGGGADTGGGTAAGPLGGGKGPGGVGGGGAGGGEAAGAAGGAEAAGAAAGGPAGAAAAAPAAAAKAPQEAAGRLGQTAAAQGSGAGAAGCGGEASGGTEADSSASAPQTPRQDPSSQAGAGEAGSSSSPPDERPPRPSQEPPAAREGAGESPPRPPAEPPPPKGDQPGGGR